MAEVASESGGEVSVSWNAAEVRAEFPQLGLKVNGVRPVYLDSAATTLKPRAVIDRLQHFYSYECANVHRGAHWLSDRATSAYEEARQKVARFLGAERDSEIVFTRGTTEGLNLIAHSFGRPFLQPGDEILLTQLEHHSNILPWQLLAQEKGLKLKVAPIHPSGELVEEEFEALLTNQTKLVSFTHVSNGLGTILPIQKMIQSAQKVGAVTVVDAAQSVSFLPLRVRDLGCDFLVFSGHKLFGPYGVGALYGRHQWLEQMPPYQSGGSMISKVSFAKSDFLPPPQRFEAGTPHIAGAIGLGAAIDFVQALGLEAIESHEQRLLTMATEELKQMGGVRLFADLDHKASILSFLMEGTHPSDVGAMLDQQAVAVRAGHHCNQPLWDFYQVPGTVRASFSLYNDEEDVERWIVALKKAKEMLL